MSIFIPGSVPSSKNSKRWTGKMLINSKTTMKYISKTKGDYLINKAKFKNKWLDDDNCEEIIPIFEKYEYDKEKPGVIISVLQ